MPPGEYKNAIREARIAAMVDTVTAHVDGTYSVPSATAAGVIYTVRPGHDGVLTCSCPAGVHGRVCVHATAVGRMAHAAGKRERRPWDVGVNEEA